MRILRRLFFNLWYYSRPPWDTGVSPPELMEFIRSHDPGRALDLGCGTGTNVITLSQHGWQVTGVDFAGRAIRIARREAHRAGVDVEMRVEDATQTTASGGLYDLALDMGCFHSLSQDDRRAYIRNLQRLLASGGTYLLFVFVKNDLNTRGPGVVDAELAEFSPTFQLVARKDTDERGWRRSAWLTFRKL